MGKWLQRLPILASGLLALACVVLALYPARQAAPIAIALEPVHTTWQSPAPPAGPIHINSADLAQLQQLPGIGPQLAQDILAARRLSPFFFPEDLKAVPGIGDRRLELIRQCMRID